MNMAPKSVNSFITEMMLHSICATMFLLLLIIPTLSQTTQKPTCGSGWFGSSYQYKCHCRDNRSCDADGACPDRFCERGWFGPGCQYVDLVFTNSNSNTPSWLSDDDNNTCSPTQTSQTINVELNSSFPFSWLRLQVKDPSLLQEFQVMFSPSSSQDNVGCEKMRTAMVSDRTLDIHCELNVTVQNVILTGEGVKSLCSLYISGGRNVALHQNTSQSSTWKDPSIGNRKDRSLAKNAVDGNRSQEFENGSCTATDSSDRNPTWNVSLSQPHIITRYVLYNRNNNMNRLKGFTLESFTEIHTRVFNHTDVETVPLYIYTITDIETNEPITKVSIQAHNTQNTKDLLLTLCEVELFGDSACPPSKYGRECKQTCNCAVKNDPCFVSTGGCPSGCSAGFQGEGCNQPCDPGKFGKECSSNCSQFCVTSNSSGTSCNHIDGACHFGCQTGYQKPRCEGLIMGNESTLVVVAAFLVVAVIVILAGLGYFLWRRYSNVVNKNMPAADRGDNNENSTEDESATLEELNPANSGNTDKDKSNKLLKEKTTIKKIQTEKIKKEETVYYNTATTRATSTSIAVDNLSNFMASHNKTFFQQQFSAIPVNTNATTVIGMSEENAHKNRYKNICAYDHSRVQLKTNKGKKHGNYINASHIQGYEGQQKFIASQGPTKVMLADFVRMLSEQDVEVVVMLTNLTEEGKKKCEQYWPEENEIKIGDIKIKLATTQVFADYTIRRLQLVQDRRPEKTLTQFHFTSWPDKDVPTTAWSLVDFEQRLSTISSNKPIVVHCSAGVGRTGTFIALHNIIREATDTGSMDFFTAVQKLRNDRMCMVQTADQYEFLHRAALVAIICMGTSVTSHNISDRMKILENTKKQGKTQLELEFNSVCSICDDSTEHSDQLDKHPYSNFYVGNKLKNRFQNILTKEDSRVILTDSSNDNDEDQEDYINAVFMPSFTKKNQQILTQLPLPTTVTDFWRMVIQYKVTFVVAFEVDLMATDSTIGRYFSMNKDDEISVPPFKIKTVKASSGILWNEQKLTVTTDTHSQKEHHVTQVTCKGLPTDQNLEDILDLMKKVRISSPIGGGRTVLMCRNGADYSGLVCAMSLLLARMDNDHHLTVPLVVGAMKAVRPQVIPTVHQYKLLYQVLKLYSDSNNVYNNYGQ